MAETWLEQLHQWHEFYVLIGTAAATLTGLMFVVVSIGPQVIATRSTGGVRTFVTPVMVHFTSVLAVSALMLVPLMTPGVLAVLLALGSLGVLTYIFAIGVHRQWRQSKLDREDWIGYIGLPVLSYLAILGSAVAIWREAASGFVIVAAAAILLLIVGIRNAWDLVIWMAQNSRS
jgi:hypothetical protein